jgi:hypothetical protein
VLGTPAGSLYAERRGSGGRGRLRARTACAWTLISADAI